MYISLDRKSEIPLFSQIYRTLRKMILNGTLAEGERLPSSRVLSGELGVSRNVVLSAYEQLLSEGFISGKTGSGTFVSKGAVFCLPDNPDVFEPEPVGFRNYRNDIVDFRSGLPDMVHFPIAVWSRLVREVYAGLPPKVLGYQLPEGMPELRKAVSDYTALRRGVVCHPEQVVITAGTTQAIGIAGRLLLSGGGIVVTEEPLTRDIREILRNAGGEPFPVPVGPDGIDTGKLPSRSDIRMVYVTPSHQFPIGTAMPIQSRINLINWAIKNGVYIMEDDYDSEFRYDGPPVSSIQGLAPENVVYIGTFSKTLFPSLRIGYMILPENLVVRGRQVKWFTDLHNTAVDQLILARFISGGHYSRHIGKMLKIYRKRRYFLEKILKDIFLESVRVLGVPCGIHLSVRFPGFDFTDEKLRQLETEGVCCYSAAGHAVYPEDWKDTLIFGYGMLDEERIEEGIKILSGFMRKGGFCGS